MNYMQKFSAGSQNNEPRNPRDHRAADVARAADQGLDVLAMALISSAIGFHMLLLPTFVIEFIPGPDMLPTWTACTAAVVMLRRKRERESPIDIAAEVTTVDPKEATKAAASDSPQVPPRLPRTENS